MGFLDYLNPIKQFEFLQKNDPVLKAVGGGVPGVGAGGMSIPGLGGGGFDIGSLIPGLGGLGGSAGGGMGSIPGLGGSGGIGSLIPGVGGDGGGLGGIGSLIPGLGGEGGGLTAGMSGGGLLGGLTGSEAIYGKKPAAVKFPSPEELVGQATKANISNVPDFLQLSKSLMEGQQPILLEALERSAPGSGEAQKGFMENILAGIRGEMSPAQLSAIKNAGAAWGINSGTGGGGIGNARDLRNIGLEATKRQDIAGAQLENFVANQRRFSMPQLLDAQTNMLRPSYDPYGQFNYANYRANVDAAPIPAAAGAAAAQQALVESVLAAYSGTPHSASAQYSNQIGGGYGGARAADPWGGGGNPWGGKYGETPVGAGAFDF